MMKKRLLFILCLFFVGADINVAQNRTVTNADLEKFRRKRIKSEKEYLENYSKLGFPSPEELEKQNTESRRRLSELSEQIDAETANSQKSFQARAIFLRTQIVSVEAQINYLRGELNRFPRQNLFLSSSYYSPYPSGGGYYNVPNGYSNSYSVQSAQSGSSVLLNTSGVQINRTTTQIQTPSPRSTYNRENNNFGIGIMLGGGNHAGYGRQHYYNRNYGFPIYYGGYVAPYFNGDRSYERDEINAQVRSLEQARAGLYAERAVLEDEARRAGVKVD